MKFYSSEVLRQHAADLAAELYLKQIEEPLQFYIINENRGSPMYDLASKQNRDWPAIGVLDLHDMTQECYCSLIKAYNRIDWAVIEASSNPRASLWAYLKKSVKLDVRKAINTFKDGMRVPLDKIWDAKIDRHVFDLDNFFSMPVENSYFSKKFGDALGVIDDYRMSSWQTEELYTALDGIMQDDLSDFERQVLEMGFGVNQPNNEKRSAKYIANFFGVKEGSIRKTKQRTLEKLRTEENRLILLHFIEN